MDWFSWLSRTNLEDSLIYEYGLSFSHNELEYEDIAFFNHDFLQSMGISIAKHRLEILKLARKDRKPSPLTARVLIAIRKTGKCFSEYIRARIRREKSSWALVVVPSGKGRWNKRSVMPSNGNGSKEEITSVVDSSMQLLEYPTGFKEIKWDSMFHNLKPT